MFSPLPPDVTVRDDIVAVFDLFWDRLARPGATLTGHQRTAVAAVARGESGTDDLTDPEVTHFAAELMQRPATVTGADVGRLVDAVGDPQTVEVIAIVSILSAVDGFHAAVGADPAPLPDARDGDPTGDIAQGLKRRRTHVPVSPGPIPFTLDLVPSDAHVFLALQGPLYMTDAEMDSDTFERSPGLNRAQMELISSRLSFHNECFY